jgi:RimJ/RimL family protein N-acetyltransferase
MPQTNAKLGEPLQYPEALSRPAETVHTGRFVSLEPLHPGAHARDLYEASHNCPEAEAVWTYLPMSGPFSSLAEMEVWLERCREHPDFVFFAVRHHQSGQLIGMLSYVNIEPQMHRLEVGFVWYAPQFQQTNVNTESVYLLLCEAFDHLGYRRVEWKCDSLNQASRKAALRLGFSFEGMFRKHMIVNGRNRDTAWYAMTDDDWRRHKPNYQRWLYENDGSLSLTEMNRSMLFASLAV